MRICVAFFALLALVLAGASGEGFDGAEVYSSAVVSAPENWEGDFWAESLYAFSGGVKLRFVGLELRYFNSNKKLSGEGLASINGAEDFYGVFSNQRYSLAFDLKKIWAHADVKVKAGSISFSSRLKNPTLSTYATPFVSALSDVSYISPSLPTKDSSKKDNAFFAGTAFHFVERASTDAFRFLPVRLEFFVQENNADEDLRPLVATVRGGFFYKNFFKLTTAFWSEMYYVSGEGEAAGAFGDDFVWWGNLSSNRSALYSAFMNETVFSLPFFKNKFLFGTIENPLSAGRFWLRDEMLFSFGAFSFGAQFFLSDNVLAREARPVPIVATSGSKKYSVWQMKFTPEIAFQLPRRATLKVGSAFFVEEKIQNYEKSSEHLSIDAKAALGAKVSSKSDAAKLTFTVSGVNVERKPEQKKDAALPKFSLAFSYSHKFASKDKVSFSASASVQQNEEREKQEYNEALRLYYYPSRGVLQSVSAGFSATQKKSGKKIQPYAKARFRFSFEKVKIFADIAVNSNFEIAASNP